MRSSEGIVKATEWAPAREAGGNTQAHSSWWIPGELESLSGNMGTCGCLQGAGGDVMSEGAKRFLHIWAIGSGQFKAG